jgi:hypothetical protein
MTKHKAVAFIGVGFLLASMALWLTCAPLSPSLLLFPAYAASVSAVMALIGSRHAGWHLLLIRLVAACTLIGFAMLGLCMIPVAILSGVYGSAIAALVAMPCLAWWHFLYSKFNWRGEGDGATAQILATGGVATLTVAVVLVVMHLVWPVNEIALITASVAAVGALLATLGGYGWKRQLAAEHSHLNVPLAQVRLIHGER